jgi:predicted RNase H-like HicB family nuclease
VEEVVEIPTRNSMMRYAVVIQAQPNGQYQATVPLLPGLTRVGETRAATLEAIREAIVAAHADTELVYVDIADGSASPPNPWLATAGSFADDPTLELMLQEIYAERDGS